MPPFTSSFGISVNLFPLEEAEVRQIQDEAAFHLIILFGKPSFFFPRKESCPWDALLSYQLDDVELSCRFTPYIT